MPARTNTFPFVNATGCFCTSFHILVGASVQVMFCIVYVYAVAGVTFYGGLVTTDETSEHYQKLAGSDYVQVCYQLGMHTICICSNVQWSEDMHGFT